MFMYWVKGVFVWKDTTVLWNVIIQMLIQTLKLWNNFKKWQDYMAQDCHLSNIQSRIDALKCICRTCGDKLRDFTKESKSKKYKKPVACKKHSSLIFFCF